jgi:hypothetical protein
MLRKAGRTSQDSEALLTESNPIGPRCKSCLAYFVACSEARTARLTGTYTPSRDTTEAASICLHSCTFQYFPGLSYVAMRYCCSKSTFLRTAPEILLLLGILSH